MYRAVHGSAACEAVFHGSVPGPPQAPGVLFLSWQTRIFTVRIALLMTKTSIHEQPASLQEHVGESGRRPVFPQPDGQTGHRPSDMQNAHRGRELSAVRRKDKYLCFCFRICVSVSGIRSYFAFLFLLKLMRQPAWTMARSSAVISARRSGRGSAFPSRIRYAGTLRALFCSAARTFGTKI